MGYQQFTQFFGDPTLGYNSNLWGFYVQDDWRVTPDLKLLYGARYDLYDVPNAKAGAPYAASRDFRVDKNNFGTAGRPGLDRRQRSAGRWSAPTPA